MIGLDPEGDKPGRVLLDERVPELDGLGEHIRGLDELIGRQHGEHRVGVILREDRSRERDSVDGITGHGLAQDVRVIEVGHRGADLLAVTLTRADVDRVALRQVPRPFRSQLEQRDGPASSVLMNLMSCLGCPSRDIGQRRVPDPPAMIIA